MSDMIQIRSIAKRNIVFSALVGLFLLVLGIILLIALPATSYLVGIFTVSFSFVMLLISWVKYREPSFSFLLSKQAIQYQCRHGKWKLEWDNVQRVDVPSTNRGMLNQKLDMVGIKLKDYKPFLSEVSPRLMTNILMEQRPLLFHGLTNEELKSCKTGQCGAGELLEDDSYKGPDGTVYKGIQAMFANRMVKLRDRLGFDIFIASSDLDRSEAEFVALLKQCQEQVISEAVHSR